LFEIPSFAINSSNSAAVGVKFGGRFAMRMALLSSHTAPGMCASPYPRGRMSTMRDVLIVEMRGKPLSVDEQLWPRVARVT
jgi:hypothetical protein